LRRLVHVFKYEKIRTLAVPLARLLVRALPREAAFDVIVPVPMHWRRRLERGFNQASLLANELGRYVGAPIASALRRPYRGTPQASLSFADRRANLRGASFTVSRPGAIAGRRVLLVDDVITTGATARACARALKSAGAAHVTVLTLARVDRRAAAHADRMRTTAATNGGK
jgi:ComF family protein